MLATRRRGEEHGGFEARDQALQDKAAVVFARFPVVDSDDVQPEYFARARALSRSVNEIASDAEALQPDSGDFSHDSAHSRRAELDDAFLFAATPLAAHSPRGERHDRGRSRMRSMLRINTTASMPIGLYREVPRVSSAARGWSSVCLRRRRALGRERGYLRARSTVPMDRRSS